MSFITEQEQELHLLKAGLSAEEVIEDLLCYLGERERVEIKQISKKTIAVFSFWSPGVSL